MIQIADSSLSIADGTTLDLADNTLIIGCANQSAAEATLATINAKIAAARNDPAGMWQGKGLTSSAARDDPSAIHGLAAIIDDGSQISDLKSQNAPYSVIVKYALNGDSDLNGVIDADDYFRMDRGYRLQASSDYRGYRNGDIDFRGGISADDFYLIDQAFVRQAAPPAMAGAAAAAARVADVLGEEFPIFVF